MRAGHLHQRAQFVVPVAAIECHQLRAAGVARVGEVRASGQFPDKTSFVRAERQRVVERAYLWDVMEASSHLWRAEIGKIASESVLDKGCPDMEVCGGAMCIKKKSK